MQQMKDTKIAFLKAQVNEFFQCYWLLIVITLVRLFMMIYMFYIKHGENNDRLIVRYSKYVWGFLAFWYCTLIIVTTLVININNQLF